MNLASARRHLRGHPGRAAGALPVARLSAGARPRCGAGAVAARQAAADLAADAAAAARCSSAPATSRWPAFCSAAGSTAGCSWRSAWPISTTSTRSTAATGSAPGRPATIACRQRPRPERQPLPPGQRWQAGLWRELLAPLDELERAAVRPQLHQRFLRALESGAAPAIAAAAARRAVRHDAMCRCRRCRRWPRCRRHCQVLLAVPNPCRFHWADIIEGRELLRFDRRRHPLRGGRDLAGLGLDEMHAHAHPLLAAWGRQGRDFVRQLDAFDDALVAQQRFALNRIDLFSDGPGATLLEQVQAHIRDLLPLAEHPQQPRRCRRPLDRLPHRAQRAARSRDPARPAARSAGRDRAGAAPLQPRDIVVMVPDIAAFAPAIRSVFGQYARGDARFIPFDIADLQQRGNNPLLLAIEWLLQLPQQALHAQRAARPARRAGGGAPLRPGGRRAAAAVGMDGGLRHPLGARPAAARGARPRQPAANRTACCSGCAACCSVMPAATRRRSRASRRIRKSAGSKRRSPARSPTWCRRCWPGPSGRPAMRRRPSGPQRLRGLVDAFLAPTDDHERLEHRRFRRSRCAAGSRPATPPVLPSRCRSAVAARSLAVGGRRADRRPPLQGRRRDLLHAAADALDPVRGRLPARHERWRLSAQQQPQRFRSDGVARARRAPATARAATTTAS